MKAGHRAIQTLIEFDKGVRRPDAGTNLFATHDLTRILEQKLQDFQRLLLQLYFGALFAQFRALQIKLEYAELHNFRSRSRR